MINNHPVDTQLFEAIVDTVRQPLLVLDKKLQVVSANHTFCRTFKVKAEDIAGHPIFGLAAGQWNKPELKTLLEEIIPRDHSFDDYEVTLETPEAGRRVMLLNGRKLWREANHMELILLAFEDITEQARKEEKIRRSEARFRFMVEGVKEYAIILMDEKGIVTEWNSGAERLLGYRDEEAVGKPAEMIFTAEDRKAGVPFVELTTAREQGCAGDERWHMRKDGSRFWGSGTVTPFFDDAGHLLGFVKVFRDMTSQKKITEELEKSNEALEHFAAVASHDLREPLRVAALYSDLLAEYFKDMQTEESRQYFSYIKDGLTRAQNLVKGLLDYSRLGRTWNPEATKLDDIAAQAVFNLKALIAEKRASIVFENLPIVKGDKTSLLRLLQNLLSNGIKYNRQENPLIEIFARRQDSDWIIAVRDNGIGIADEHRSRIFKMFQRLHSVDQYEGTGIGLAACKKIVESHGGRIWMESNPEQGSTFFFTIPAA